MFGNKLVKRLQIGDIFKLKTTKNVIEKTRKKLKRIFDKISIRVLVCDVIKLRRIKGRCKKGLPSNTRSDADDTDLLVGRKFLFKLGFNKFQKFFKVRMNGVGRREDFVDNRLSDFQNVVGSLFIGRVVPLLRGGFVNDFQEKRFHQILDITESNEVQILAEKRKLSLVKYIF